MNFTVNVMREKFIELEAVAHKAMKDNPSLSSFVTQNPGASLLLIFGGNDKTIDRLAFELFNLTHGIQAIESMLAANAFNAEYAVMLNTYRKLVNGFMASSAGSVKDILKMQKLIREEIEKDNPGVHEKLNSFTEDLVTTLKNGKIK